jgi:hypothetical protein
MKFSVSECLPLKVTGFSYLTVGNDDEVLYYYDYYYCYDYYEVVPGPASATGYGYNKFYSKI